MLLAESGGSIEREVAFEKARLGPCRSEALRVSATPQADMSALHAGIRVPVSGGSEIEFSDGETLPARRTASGRL